MIKAHFEQHTRYVTQSDHAHLAAEILSLWILDEMPNDPHRAELIEAVREHDSGWREADSSPEVHPGSGVPFDFLSMESSRLLEIWQLSAERASKRGGLMELMVLTHAIRLHKQREPSPWLEALHQWQQRLAELTEECPFSRDELERYYRLLKQCDELSLLAASSGECQASSLMLSSATQAAKQENVEDSLEVIELPRFPLAGSTTFKLPCRYLTQTTFGSHSAFAVQLATARWQSVSVRLCPAQCRDQLTAAP